MTIRELIALLQTKPQDWLVELHLAYQKEDTEPLSEADIYPSPYANVVCIRAYRRPTK